MTTMKRMLALLLALAMVMPNCMTIASAYDEESVGEVVEELVEEIVENPEEVVEEVFEEVYEEEIYEEEVQGEVSEQVAEEVVEEASDLSSSADVANHAEAPSELGTLSWNDPNAVDDSEKQFAAYANGILFPHQPATVGTAGKDALAEGSNALELYNALVNPIKKIADGETNSSIVTVTLEKALDQTGLDKAITALLMDMPFNLYWYDKVRGLSVGISGKQYTFYFRVAEYYATGELTEVPLSATKVFSGYTTTNLELTGAANAAAANARTVATQTAFAEYSGGSCNTPYDRLMAYIEWIEEAVDYDTPAANAGGNYFSVTDCNPWQIIYVFDGLSSTKVVCEGYSKALQYLCEYAVSQQIAVPEVFSVTGDFRDMTRGGGGRHMWNIVVLDGKNYLVDVTNADGGWNAILRGVPAVTGSYTYFAKDSNGKNITKDNILQHTVKLTAASGIAVDMLYAYDPETMALFSEHLPKLTLSGTDYVFQGGTPDGGNPEDPSANTITQLEFMQAMGAAGSKGQYTLKKDLVIGPNGTGAIVHIRDNFDNHPGTGCHNLIIDGGSITVTSGNTLTLDGTITIRNGGVLKIKNGGTMRVTEESTITLENNNSVVNEGTWTIDKSEAYIGSQAYATLEEALAAAVNGTVILKKNIVRAEPVKVTQDVTIIKNRYKANVVAGSSYEITETEDAYKVNKKMVLIEHTLNNLRLQDVLRLGFYFSVETEDTVESVGALVWTEEQFKAESDFTVTSTRAKQYKNLQKGNDGNYSIETEGVYAQNLDTKFYMIPYVKTADGYTYGNHSVFSALDYIEIVYGMQDAAWANARSLVIDLANYATAARAYFCITENLPVPENSFNSFMTEADQQVEYTDALHADYPTVNESGEYKEAALDLVNINLLEAISLGLYYANADDMAGAYYWTESAYNAVAEHTAENKSGDAVMQQMNAQKKANVPNLYAYMIYDNYYVRPYNAEGQLGATTGVSIASYLTQLVEVYADATAPNLAAAVKVAEAMLVYGYNAAHNDAINKGC